MTTRKKHDQKPDSEKKLKEQVKEEEKVEIFLKELEDLQNKARSASEYHDKMLRALAEMENLRKRLDKEKKDFYNLANQELISELLPVLDNFDRSLSAADATPASNPYRQGIEMIYKQLEEVLEKQGLEEIKAVGESFDPFFHEAVQQEETDKYPDSTVLEVLLKGYLLKGKLLRPAAVKVSRKISPSPDESGQGEKF